MKTARLQKLWKEFATHVTIAQAEMQAETQTDPPLDLFGWFWRTENWIQTLKGWMDFLQQLKLTIHQTRQSYGRGCPGVIVAHVLSFLTFSGQRIACRTHSVWARAIASAHSNIYLPSNCRKILSMNLSSVLDKKYKLAIAGSVSHYHCSVVANNQSVAIADHYNGHVLYTHDLGTIFVRRCVASVSKVMHLSNQGLLLYKKDLNSDQIFEAKLEETMLREMGCHSSFSSNCWSGILVTTRKVFTRRNNDNFQANYMTSDGKVIVWIFNIKTKKIVRMGKICAFRQSDWRFNSKMIIDWENPEVNQSIVQIWKFKDNSITEIAFGFRILSLDVNEKDELVILSLENEYLYLHVYQVLE
jgi:hypothetical protein